MSTATLERPSFALPTDFYLTTPPPVYLGPTWAVDPAWDRKSPLGQYLLPEITLGWQAIAWVEGIPGRRVEGNLRNDEDSGPFRLTFEQKRLLLWWYALDENGIFAYREGILQRLKGWGKDPFAAVLSAVEFVGPCRFAGWAAEDMPDKGLMKGDPVAKEHPRAWIQIAAVSKEQTVNTMTLFPGLFSKACVAEHSIDLGKEIIYAYQGSRRFQAVTSSPRALEGGRPTLVIKNETHHWRLSNEGHSMAEVIERNATKSKDGASRTLSITNAYEPSEDSVAQREREAWEDEQSGLSISTGVLYDSIEAGPDALIALPDKPDGSKPTEAEVRAYIGAIINSVRGDAVWLNVPRIVNSILDRKNAVSTSRRFYYNQVVAAEDSWADPKAIEAAVDPLAREALGRVGGADIRAGWLVQPSEEIVLFFDGSKSEDSTGLVGCRVSDGYVFTVGVWQKPRGDRGANWLAPREAIDDRVMEAHERFNVVAFFADPSHALDDEDSSRYWDALIDKWHRAYKDRYQLWATKSGDNQHSIMWDMTSPERSRQFTAAAERFITELESKNDIEEFAPEFSIDGHPALVAHMRNAKRYPHPKGYGVSLWKGAREANKKIDLAVCAVGARLLRRLTQNRAEEEKPKRSGVVW